MTTNPITEATLQACLAGRYGLTVHRLEPVRDSGNTTYIVHAGEARYFLRVTKPAFCDTARTALDVQTFLQARDFPVPGLIPALDGQRYVFINDYLLSLQELLEGDSLEQGQEADRVGVMLGRLHACMADYPNALIRRDRTYFVDRFYELLRAKHNENIKAFVAIGEALWESVQHLPRGYAHGDAYPGNFHRTPEGRLYLLDLDTSCYGIPAYDLALFGNQSDFFDLQPDAAQKTHDVFITLLPAYRTAHPLTEAEERALYRLIALYHFALQPTIVDLFGPDCVDSDFFNEQLLWHQQWRAQCEALHLW